MKAAPRIALVGLLALTLLAMPLLPDGPLRALQVDQQRVSLAFAEDGGGAWISAPLEGDHTIAGLTWDDAEDAPAQAQVRVRQDGSWGDWQDVVVDDEHAPDPGSREERGARGGTSPIVVEGADAVQFRVNDSGPPADLAADLVAVDDPDASRRIRERTSTADAAPARPAIRPRSDWGGGDCPGRDPEQYVEYADQVQVMFVHHTAGANAYSRADVPRIIRGICSYHVNGRGWDDIGYNALVDKYGGIWEGRAGGIAKGVQGAHTGGFNSASTGVALMGNHGSPAPTTAAQDALVRYAAWKLDVHNVDPLGNSWVVSSGNSKYGDGEGVTLRNMSGHRDASFTSCPGNACYSLLNPDRPGNIPTRVDARGGFRIFGGWAQKHTMELRDDGTWERPTFGFRFSERATWTFQLRDRTGRVLLSRQGDTGRRNAPVYIEWDATVDGRPAPMGAYSTSVTARRVADGRAASPSDHVTELGGTLGDFDDVSRGDVFHDDIEWLAQQRITLGCNPPTNSEFCPEDTVTRGQMAAFLTRALDLPAGDGRSFRDVPRSHTFHDDILRLARAGITRGCNPPANDRYCPEDPVSRQQMAAFLVRALGLQRVVHPGFRDVPAGGTFDQDVRRLATAGVTRGCNPPRNDRFCPSESVTRGQMSAFLRRGITR